MKSSGATFPHGLMLHHGHRSGDGPRSQGSVSSEAFRELLEVHGPENFLTPAEWMERLEAGSLQDRHLCMTFDDGLRCQHEVFLPILEEYGIKAFWFVYTGIWEESPPMLEIYAHFRFNWFDSISDFYRIFFQTFRESGIPSPDPDDREAFIRERMRNFPYYTREDLEFRYLRDRHFTAAQYRELMDGLMARKGAEPERIARQLWMDRGQVAGLAGEGHEVGLHSHSHPTVMADLPAERQSREYERNYRILREVCGRRPRTASHPCNSYNADTLKVLGGLGIRCAFRANMKPAPSGGVNPSSLELAREDPANLR